MTRAQEKMNWALRYVPPAFRAETRKAIRELIADVRFVKTGEKSREEARKLRQQVKRLQATIDRMRGSRDLNILTQEMADSISGRTSFQ